MKSISRARFGRLRWGRAALLFSLAIFTSFGCADDTPTPSSDTGFDVTEDAGGGTDSGGADTSTDAVSDSGDETDGTGNGFEEVLCGQPEDVSRDLPDLYELRDCTTYRGSIILSDFREPELLQYLTNLRVIEGQLSLFRVYELTNLSPLSNLQRVGGQLSIRRVEDLESLQGLSSLESVGAFFMEDCVLVSSPAGLESLEVINGGFLLSQTSLESLSEFESLQRIKGEARIQASVVPIPQEELDAFFERVQVDGEIIIR